ncbi:MAG: peptidyl-prolyl cis-trans isomerase [Meiothermus sp.]|uniref:peptidylprolyl isomerase n=1 Tax=Meiothermus sp. TaxID=1955249 RepID=UPI0025F0F34E|nr:peptidylprolyl isomerase [Meiothermus sp.]MCS7057806.1 peptidyl-prolyl cis-trans isomerase [Meiothermus sp.]MCS7194649.1 peptidyl-prolyl cis-trans isomerase [Meiothermus sp.]MDW8481836.1 peptidyl-prolyl cis-trans isomerase [Meiothermus sp.]
MVGVVFGVLALAFVVGSILLFTPQGQRNPQGKTVLTVNGRAVSELELARARQSDPFLSTNPQGLLKNLLEIDFANRFVTTTALLQDTARIRVSGGELKKELDSIRERFGLQRKEDYDRFLTQVGYTDSQLRGELRDQIRINKRVEEIQKKAEPTEEEMRLYFELNRERYRNEERVLARQIVLDDKATAEKVYAQATAPGADFAALAKAHSKLNAEQGGALGAEAGKSEPGPVTRVVFPNAVAEAVFKLRDGQVTKPIEAGGRFYIVKVEKYLPASDATFEEVKDRVREDAKQVKARGALEAYLEQLRAKANVKVAEGTEFRYENPVVAKVNEAEIHLADVTQQAFANPQTLQLLQQGLGEIVVGFFLAQSLEQLIQREVIVQAAKELGQPFFGAKTDIATQAQQWKTREIAVTDAEVRKYYDSNPARFTIPASARVQAVSFKKEDRAKAEAFRAAALKGGKLEDLVKANGGTLQDYGTANPNTLPPVPNRLVFLTRGSFPKGPLGEVSEVVKLEDGSFQVLIVNDRKAEVLRPFEEVKEEARQMLLATRRAEAAQKWVEERLKAAKVENNLQKVLATLTPKEEPKREESGSGSSAPQGQPNQGPSNR